MILSYRARRELKKRRSKPVTASKILSKATPAEMTAIYDTIFAGGGECTIGHKRYRVRVL